MNRWFMILKIRQPHPLALPGVGPGKNVKKNILIRKVDFDVIWLRNRKPQANH